jgi:8-oxo-dGTP diphosphatase
MIDYEISFHDLSKEKTLYNYVVIVAEYDGKLVWVRQHGQNSWEIPGGHIESNETPEMAARRELWEETGALEYTLTQVCDFSVTNNGKQSYNRLFYCKIDKLGQLPKMEIEEISFRIENPEVLTHGTIQLTLIDKVKETLNIRLVRSN